MRVAALLAGLALAAAAEASAAVATDDAALAADDACLADASSEACGLSMRQLRGITKHGQLGEVDLLGDGAGGFCCYSGASAGDVCGTCYATAKAQEGTFCHSSGKCGGCGGTWCKAQCVFASADPSDACGTAYDTAIAAEGEFCSTSATSCAGCSGTWCGVSSQAKATKAPAKGAAESNATSPASNASDAQGVALVQGGAAAGGFCCFSGASSGDMCGTCYPTAQAEVGSFCASEDQCGGCKGTWCTAQCVFSAADPSDTCGTAYDTAIAAEDTYCAKSKPNCGTCKGTWCPKSQKAIKAPAEGAAESSTASPASNASDAKGVALVQDSDAAGGFCCHSGASVADMCGTCYATAKAEEGSFCSSKTQCGGCGGTWCTAQCVFSGEDPYDLCGTAYDTAIAAEGGFCSKSGKNCAGCKGTWCYAKRPKVAAQPATNSTA